MIGTIILSLIGIVFVVLGISIWRKDNIQLFHDYHIDKVSEEDKHAFCRMSGCGILIMGLGMLLAGIIVGITDSLASFIFLAIGFVSGLVLLVAAGIKYNR